jgi:glycosyltransferase involved in cell wall biosynthesis
MCLGHLPRSARVVIFDGAFDNYPHEINKSTDGTLEIARRWGAKVVPARRYPEQIDKRNRTLIEGETIFILDADEMLHTDMPALPDDADVGWVTVLNPSIYTEAYLEPRVFRVGEGWRYDGRHHWIFDADGRLVASHQKPGDDYRHVILPVTIENASDMREPDKNAERMAHRRAEYEKEMRVESEASVVRGGAQG